MTTPPDHPVIPQGEILKQGQPLIFAPRNAPSDPNKFFNSPRVYIRNSFRERILPALKPVAHIPQMTYGVGYLQKNASDREIRPLLPPQHLAHWTAIAGLIKRLRNGRKGYYLLYLEGSHGVVFAVDVFWRAEDRRWDVREWGVGGRGEWSAGGRVLYPVTKE